MARPLFRRSADGTGLGLALRWSGPLDRGRAVLAGLGRTGATLVEGEAVAPHRETLDHGEIWPWGQSWVGDTWLLGRITPQIAGLLADLAAAMPAPDTILLLHDFHGRAARVPPAETAFPLRRDHFVVLAIGRIDERDAPAAARQRRWIDAVASALAPHALPGAYVNFLSPDRPDRARAFYGDACARLEGVKARVDPDDLFRTGVGRLRH